MYIIKNCLEWCLPLVSSTTPKNNSKPELNICPSHSISRNCRIMDTNLSFLLDGPLTKAQSTCMVCPSNSVPFNSFIAASASFNVSYSTNA